MVFTLPSLFQSQLSVFEFELKSDLFVFCFHIILITRSLNGIFSCFSYLLFSLNGSIERQNLPDDKFRPTFN